MHPAAQAWYALYTRHQHEKTVAQVLSNKDFEVFLPLYEVTRRWTDRDKRLSAPLFPGYVFLHGGMDRRLDVVVTPGVHFIVGATQPAVIPDEEIDAIRRALQSRKRVEPHPFLKTGDWVRMKRGALTGIEGILVRRKGLFRLVLSVELLGKSVSVEVEAIDVEPITRRVPARATA